MSTDRWHDTTPFHFSWRAPHDTALRCALRGPAPGSLGPLKYMEFPLTRGSSHKYPVSARRTPVPPARANRHTFTFLLGGNWCEILASTAEFFLKAADRSHRIDTSHAASSEGGMSSSEQPDITDMLLAWSQGDEASLQKLLPLVYEDLRRMARRYMNLERSGHTLQTTALVHEAYERLVDTPRVRWRDRAHFLAVCAQLMRRVLVD